MGNRGCLHDDQQRIVRQTKRDAWVTCALEFKGRRRHPLMNPNEYTELFFLDEATALAAGHRPCAECRRRNFTAFADAWAKAISSAHVVRAGEIDARLKLERSPDARARRNAIDRLPDGTFVKQVSTGQSYLLYGDKAYLWSFDGYREAIAPRLLSGPFVLLTPESTIKALEYGYRPGIHSSAV
jgi:hypothetical protein